jgi:serine/threonine protein phosphatase PrpC
MRSARLLGRDHHELGAVAAIAEGRAAITLCRGGARKTYPHTEPNEDATCFALGEGGMVAAVADGHQGAQGAERAIAFILERCADSLTARRAAESSAAGWSRAARELLTEAHAEVIEQGREHELGPAPTTLSIALVRPAQDLLLHASVGDSHVFVAPRDARQAVRDLGWASTGRRRTFFLGEEFEGGGPGNDHWALGCESLRDAAAVVLASDGLSERNIGVADPAAAVGECVAQVREIEPALRPLEACRRITEVALDAQRSNRAGDNVATAVLWLS